MADPIEPVPDLPPDLDPGVARWLEMAEARAYLDVYAAAAEQPGNPAGAATAVIGGAVALALTALDVRFFDRVVGLGIAREATRDDVDAAARFYRDRGLTQSVIHVAPGARPPDLPDWLAAEGYVPGSRWVKLWHDLRGIAQPAPALRIERIDASLAQTWGDVCLAGFEMPPHVRPISTAAIGRPGWSHYLGYEGGTPVSTAAMHVEDGVAWLGYGATLPGSRGRGWQTSMLLRRLRDARDADCRLAVTETGEETDDDPVNHSYRNMLRAGFHLGYARRNWYRA